MSEVAWYSGYCMQYDSGENETENITRLRKENNIDIRNIVLFWAPEL